MKMLLIIHKDVQKLDKFVPAEFIHLEEDETGEGLDKIWLGRYGVDRVIAAIDEITLKRIDYEFSEGYLMLHEFPEFIRIFAFKK